MFRAAIEEEYSNRLINLAKATLGKDEIGFVHRSLRFYGPTNDGFYLASCAIHSTLYG